MLGLTQKVSGTLTLTKGTFESIALSDALDTSVAQTGLTLECIRGEVRATKGGPSFHGDISLKGGEGANGQERWRINAKVRWDARGIRV